MSRDEDYDEQRIRTALGLLERIADALERLEKRNGAFILGGDGGRCGATRADQYGRTQCLLSDGHDGLCNFDLGDGK